MSRSAPAEKGKPLPERFEEAMVELESLVEQMESGRLPLEASLATYKRGAELVRHCRDKLAAVTQQVEVLEAGLLTPYREREADEDIEARADASGPALRGREDE